MSEASSHPGKGMREPRLTQRNYLVQSNLSKLLKDSIKCLPSGRRLQILDCGCGEKPYLPFFKSVSSLYVGIDVTKGHADIIGSVEKLPFKDSHFDLALCTQVMEHVASPQDLIDEIYRVVKKNSFLFLSTHGIWPVHAAPNDFWRWTDLGLKKMLAKFSTIKIHECGGSVASFFQIMNLYLPTIPHIRPILSVLLNVMGQSLDARFGGRSARLIVNYLAIAKK
jgi:SAM-dependent methyltransferase